MSISIKTPEEIEKMRAAGKLAASVLEMIGEHVKPGVTTEELDDICHKYITDHGAYPAPLNYHGFPKSICTSVNHCVCHGIPGPKKLKDGDIIISEMPLFALDSVDAGGFWSKVTGSVQKLFN